VGTVVGVVEVEPVEEVLCGGGCAGEGVDSDAEQSLGCDEPVVAAPAGERGCHAPSGLQFSSSRSLGLVDLSAQNHELAAKHDDLEVFEASGTDSASGEGGQVAVEDVQHDSPGRCYRA